MKRIVILTLAAAAFLTFAPPAVEAQNSGHSGHNHAAEQTEEPQNHKEHADHDDHGIEADMPESRNSAPENHSDESPEEHEEHDDHKGDHKEDSGHKDHEEKNEGKHEGHDDHAGKAIRIAPEYRESFDIRTQKAGPGTLRMSVDLPGEITVNRNETTRIVPRVSGIVHAVEAELGDAVSEDDLLAVIESRDLSDAKAAYLAAKERLQLARENYERESNLKEKGVTSEQDYQSARAALAEARISLRNAMQKLSALGISEAGIKAVADEDVMNFSRYEVRAPFDATIIEKEVARGGVVKSDEEIFIVSDLNTLWLDISVYQKDMNAVHKGDKVLISMRGRDKILAEETIAYVSPVVDEHTRTALARVYLNNRDGRWRAGQFVTAHIITQEIDVKLAVQKTALQDVEGQTSVFVKSGGGYKPRAVRIGRRGEARVEILEGLKPGEEYVSHGAFTVKAQGAKSELEGGHNH